MPKVKWQGREVEGLEIPIRRAREDWNEYDLDDESKLRLKTVVSEIVRLQGEYDQENNPIYLVKLGYVLVANSPDNLKREFKAPEQK